MITAQDFKKKTFKEQIEILNSIGERNEIDSLQDLYNLYLYPLNDKAVDAMVEHTLRDLLSKNEKETVKGIASKEIKIKRLCLQITGRLAYKTAAPTLLEMAQKEKNPVIIDQVFQAMFMLNDPGFLPVYQKNIRRADDLIAAQCIKILGENKELKITRELIDIVEEAETEDRFEICSIPTAQAIETLAELHTNETAAFLVSKLHHKNPTARRIVIEELVKWGPPVIPFIAKQFDTGNTDNKILAANTLALIGDKEGGAILISALDDGKADDPNVKFAIYEAFGGIKFMKGVVCLVDALLEEDPLLLISVVNSLDKQLNPFVIDKIKTIIEKNDDQGRKILKAIIASESLAIFEALYENHETSDRMIKIISLSNDEHIISVFAEKLKTITGDHVKNHLETLLKQPKVSAGLHVLAVDDSKSMLSFYRTTLTAQGYKVTTAINGQDGLDAFDREGTFDIVISDMNMPGMDGIMLTRKLRENPFYQEVPIIMVTTESDCSQQQLACSAGVNGFVIKPFTAEKLIETIRTIRPTDRK